jgi:glycogen synthase
MRILILCYEYPPIGGGGGRVAKSIGEEMARRGHQVRVQTAGMRHLPKHETIAGVDIFRAESFRKREDTCTVFEMGLFLATSFFPTLRHIRSWQPDVIHAHFAVPTGALAFLAHAITRVPYVITAHLGDVPGGVPEQTDKLFRLVGPATRLIWKKAAAVTAVSGFVKDIAEKAYRRPVVKILNGIRLGNAPGPSIVHNAKHFVFVGRFGVQKNPVFAVDVLSMLTHLNWKLTMIGDGPLMPDVSKRIDVLKLQDRVTLTGWVTSDEVERILKDADILLMPSLSEGMPMAAVEALKFGLAIVGSDIPGLKDVVEHGVNGYLVPVCDLNAFVHKLGWLLDAEDALLAMKDASRKKAHEFDLDAIAAQYEAVLTEAAKLADAGKK